jgi:hypothetical protein
MHPGDMIAGRIRDGSHVMLVASAHWDDERKRFRVRRPPGNVSSIAIDSGGFTAAQRWGRYPWTVEQYADFIREEVRSVPLDFCASMDYACERGVDRSALTTNRERIEATVHNELACREAAPSLPWLPVLQGNTFEERTYGLELRYELDLLPRDYAGIGSICGRSPREAGRVVQFYQRRLPGIVYHGFGMHVQALDDDRVFWSMRSWDSYAWNWGRGQKDLARPAEYLYRDGETWTTYTRRLAELYWQNTVLPRLQAPRQRTLFV